MGNPLFKEHVQRMDAETCCFRCGNEGLNLELSLCSAQPPTDSADPSGRGRIAAVRNLIIARFLKPRHRYHLKNIARFSVSRLPRPKTNRTCPQRSYVFWLDADLTVVPTSLITELQQANPRGVTAPLVLLDDRPVAALRRAAAEATAEPRLPWSVGAKVTGVEGNAPSKNSRFYDTAAFVEEGQRVQRTAQKSMSLSGHRNYGSVSSLPPYFRSRVPGANPAAAAAVACDSVGTTYLIPAEVYRWVAATGSGSGSGLEGAASGVAIRHYAHALTEHFPVVHAAKYVLGLPVVALASVAVWHADLPRFGEAFHGTAFNR